MNLSNNETINTYKKIFPKITTIEDMYILRALIRYKEDMMIFQTNAGEH